MWLQWDNQYIIVSVIYRLQVVSFKWLARQFSVPANTAKKVLSEFLEKNQGKVSATYLISGWTKGPEPEHSIQLVDAGSLTERRKKLDPITSLHVYSIQPTQPKVNLIVHIKGIRTLMDAPCCLLEEYAQKCHCQRGAWVHCAGCVRTLEYRQCTDNGVLY